MNVYTTDKIRNVVLLGHGGCGLIGGSLARAVRNKLPEAYMIAYDTNVSSLELAVKDGVINEACTQIGDSFEKCDYIFLCAPVSFNDENLITLQSHLSKNAVLTDVGSVKTGIHEHITALGLVIYASGNLLRTALAREPPIRPSPINPQVKALMLITVPFFPLFS